jgi:hypothetical protein
MKKENTIILGIIEKKKNTPVAIFRIVPQSRQKQKKRMKK